MTLEQRRTDLERLMGLLPARVETIPPELDEALQGAEERGDVETIWSPDGEEGMVRRKEKDPGG